MRRSIVWAAVWMVSLCARADAQGFGTIVGTVTDPSEALVPAAKVTVTEVGTGLSRSVTSDQQGRYVLPSLRPTDYDLSVEARGFRKYTQAGITLLADQSLTVNVKLQLGVSSDTVTVEAAATQVNTTTATLGQVIEQARVLELPLNGRNAAQLTLAVPGAVSSPSGGADQGATKTIPGAVTISTNGSRQNQISYMLDGGNNVDEYTTVNQPFPFPDALQEFSVQTSNYSAQYGENAGGVVNVVTRSGANDLHGDLFEFNRNRSYNARNFFAAERDPLKRNQFGGTVGGRIIKDRTFFFAGYQGTRQRTATLQSTIVPTAAQRAAATDTASKNLLTFLPQTSDPGGNVSYFRPDNQNFDEVVGKVDHSLRQNDQLSFRWYYDRFQRQGVFDSTNILNYLDAATIPSQNYLIHETHTFGSNKLNEFHFSFSREAAQRGPLDGVPSVRDLGVNIPFQPTRNAIQTVSVSNAFSFGDNPDATFIRNNFTWSDDVSWVRGRHDLRFGGTVERSRVDLDNLFQQPGEFRFLSISDFLTGKLGGNPGFRQGFGEFKNNRNTFAGLYLQDNFRVSRRLTLNAGLRWEPSLPWREIKGRVEQFRLSDFFAGTRSRVFPNAPPGLFFPGDAGVPANGTEGSLNLFAPRLGFAYDVFGDGKTSLRGGVGVFFDSRTPGIFNNRFVDVTPFSPQLTFSSPPGPFSDPLCQKTSGCTPVSSPFPAAIPPPSNVAFPLPVLAVTYDPGAKYLAPTMYNWNLAIEREVSAGWLVRVAYAGSHTSRIREQIELNPAPALGGTTLTTATLDSRRILNTVFPSATCTATLATGCLFQSVALDSHDVNASYNALQLSLERRVSHGVTILTHYTYSKSLDDLPYVIGSSGVADLGAGDALSPVPWFDPTRHQWDRGPSDFDHTHRFALSYVAPLPGFTSSSSLARVVLGGWKFSGLVQKQTGRPLTPMSGRGSGSDFSQTGLGRDRAVFLGGNPYFDGMGTNPCAVSTTICVPYLNPSAFAQPAVGTFGNAGKGSLRFPGVFTWDMGFLKDFRVTERVKVQFRAEFFNIFNHVNFTDDNSNADNTTRRNNNNFSALKSASDPRIGQLALKIFF